MVIKSGSSITNRTSTVDKTRVERVLCKKCGQDCVWLKTRKEGKGILVELNPELNKMMIDGTLHRGTMIDRKRDTCHWDKCSQREQRGMLI